MSGTMNNMELTRAVQELQMSTTDIAQRLAAAIPKIEQDVSNSESDIKIMFESLKQEFKPYIDQIAPAIDLINNLQTQLNVEKTRINDAEILVVKMNEDNKLRDQQIKTAEGLMTEQTQSMGVEGQARINMETRISDSGTNIEALYHELEAQKRKQEVNYQQQQMQIATAMSSSTTAGTHGASPMKGEPLATNKLLMSDERIDGTESRQTLEDWFDDVAMKINLVYPGAQAILDLAAQRRTDITSSEIERRRDNILATSLSLQLFVFLKCKTKALGCKPFEDAQQ